jgi:hypothetical protein
MINAGLPMATPEMAGISNIIGGLPADPNETALQQYIQQLAAQGKTGTPEYLMAGGELQHRQNLREEAMAQQAAGVQQQPPVMQQLAQAPQPQMPPQMQQQQQPMPNMPTMPNPAQSMQDQLGATPQIQPGIMNASQAGGIETLPAENLNNIENYAGGGIVAFDEGGEVPAYGIGGKIRALMEANKEQDAARQADLKQRIRAVYDQGQTTLPADFFKPGDYGGRFKSFKHLFSNTVKRDLAQKELDSMWADKSKADLAAFFSGPGGVQRRLSAEDVEKYDLAGGGVVAFEGGGPTSPFGRFIESAKKSAAEESELLTLQEALANQYRSAANIPGLFMSQTDAQRQQAKDIMNRLTSMKPAEMRSLLAAGKAPEKSNAATTAAKAAQSLDTDYPSEGKRGSATLTTPSGTLPGHRFDTLPSTKKQEEKPAPDKVDAGLAALASRLKPMKEPTLDEVGTERAEYYKKLGIPENPYADALKKAQAKAGPEQDEKDRKRMFWETIGAIGSGLGEATSRQTNKRAQFLEDASRGLKRGLEKAPEGLRELEKRKEARDKAIDDLQLAQINYTKSGADADLKRVDDKATRAANYNADVLKSQITLEVARLQNSGLITEREAKRETDRRTSAITLATNALKESSLTIPVGSPEYDAQLKKLTAYFYGTLKDGSFGAVGAGGALQQTGKGSFNYVPPKN